jgi:hypothetical protein
MLARYSLIISFLVTISATTARADAYEWTYSGYLMMVDASDWDGVTGDDILFSMVRSTWHDAKPNRAEVVTLSLLEAATGLCGAAADHKYNVVPGAEWCSEFARTELLAAGAQDERCTNNICESLSNVTGVDDFEDYFRFVAGWTAHKYVNPYQVQPGDYVAFNLDGNTANHSAIVVAVSNDYRYIWTSEGNVDDCVHFMRRDFFIDGSLTPSIYGIGEADKVFP